MGMAASTVKKPSRKLAPSSGLGRRRCERKQTPRNRVRAMRGRSWEKTMGDASLLQEQLIDAPHQRKALRAFALGRVIEPGSPRAIANGIDDSSSVPGEGASPSPAARPGSSTGPCGQKIPFNRQFADLGVKLTDLAFMISPAAIHTVREHLAKPFDRLGASMCSPGSDAPGASEAISCSVRSCSVRSPRIASSATFAFKSPENLRLLLIAYPSSVGGIHLKRLSDFPAPPQYVCVVISASL